MNAYSIWYRRTDYWNVKSLIQKRDTCHSESILSNQMSKLNDLCFNQRFSICTIILSKRVQNRYPGPGSGKSETLGEYGILVGRTVFENSKYTCLSELFTTSRWTWLNFKCWRIFNKLKYVWEFSVNEIQLAF